MRQALKCAVGAVRLMGRSKHEAALREAVLLKAAGDDPGPADREFLTYKRFPGRKPDFSTKSVMELADLPGLVWDKPLVEAVDHGNRVL